VEVGKKNPSRVGTKIPGADFLPRKKKVYKSRYREGGKKEEFNKKKSKRVI